MQFIKNLFKDETVIGLSGIRKQREFVRVTIPDSYKKTYIANTQKNYFLI